MGKEKIWCSIAGDPMKRVYIAHPREKLGLRLVKMATIEMIFLCETLESILNSLRISRSSLENSSIGVVLVYTRMMVLSL